MIGVEVMLTSDDRGPHFSYAIPHTASFPQPLEDLHPIVPYSRLSCKPRRLMLAVDMR
jgi:hypothetical protein